MRSVQEGSTSRVWLAAVAIVMLMSVCFCSAASAQSFDAAPFGPIVGQATYVSTVVACAYGRPCETTATVTQHQILADVNGGDNGGGTDRAYFCGTYDLVVAYCNPASWLGWCPKTYQVSPTRIIGGISITVTIAQCANPAYGNCKAVSGQIAHDLSLLPQIITDAASCAY